MVVNSILSSLSTFYMCLIKESIEILEQIDKYQRHFFMGGRRYTWQKTTLGCMEIGV
jgi:hypothetical protein